MAWRGRWPAALMLVAALWGGAARAEVFPSAPLDRMPEALLSVELPPASRGEIPDPVPVTGPWRLLETADGVRAWEAPMPVRLRTFFYSLAPDDLSVVRKGEAGRLEPLEHGHGVLEAGVVDTWAFSADGVRVRRPATEGPPASGEYFVTYSAAIERERSLNWSMSGQKAEDFLFRSVQVGDTTRKGLLLPAPAHATFSVDVPAGAVLDLSVGLVPPELSDEAPTTGAVLEISIGEGGPDQRVLSEPLELGAFETQRVSLAPWAGKKVQIRFATATAGDPQGDYVFVAEPRVHVPQERPPRVLLVFVDTLRRDHLSLYGYERPTTPHIDAWAKTAAVFETARSVAPWTLPSTRSMLTGAIPERWGLVQTLQERFARAGWATGFLVGNIYLSSNFEMDRDWGEHRCTNWPRAEVQVNRALNFLEEHADEPVFLGVHFMDQHLPYTEPLRYRFRYAGWRPAALQTEFFLRYDVMRAAPSLGPEGKQHIRDRYDNNLNYVDDQLQRLLSQMTDQDTVLFLSDHGEEFWDHGNFEHGQSLYDELLRVPLIVSSPGMRPGRYEEPVSLIDVAPTLARAAGLSTDQMLGWPLQALADRSRADEFTSRPVAFGRPLYGMRAWGSIADNIKYVTTRGDEHLLDLKEDPREVKDIFRDWSAATPLREAMASALGVPVVLAWRLLPHTWMGAADLNVTLTVPGGVVAAWAGDDPTAQSAASVVVNGETVKITWDASRRAVREVFVVPEHGAQQALATLHMEADAGAVHGEGRPQWRGEPPPPDGEGDPLVLVRTGGRTVELGYAVVPLPVADGTALTGYNAEVSGELEALGYIEK